MREIKFRAAHKGKILSVIELHLPLESVIVNMDGYHTALQRGSFKLLRHTTTQEDGHEKVYWEGDILEREIPYEVWQTHEGDNIPLGSYSERCDFGFKKERFKVVFYNGCALAVPIYSSCEEWKEDWHYHILMLKTDTDYFEEIVEHEIRQLEEGEFEKLYGYKDIEEILDKTQLVAVGNIYEDDYQLNRGKS